MAVLLQFTMACGSDQLTTGSRASLVVGTVRAGPISPVARPGRPNTRPLPGAIVEALRNHRVITATHSDDRGRYELSLPPGAFLIRAKGPGRFLSRSAGKDVTTSAGERVTVNFWLDTGIR